MKIYMEVTSDEYELSVIVADSVKELARKSGGNRRSITTMICRWAKGKRKKSRYVSVEVDDEEGEQNA